jgi:hypothetical protein
MVIIEQSLLTCDLSLRKFGRNLSHNKKTKGDNFKKVRLSSYMISQIWPKKVESKASSDQNKTFDNAQMLAS